MEIISSPLLPQSSGIHIPSFFNENTDFREVFSYADKDLVTEQTLIRISVY